jgi:hypothetical protein
MAVSGGTTVAVDGGSVGPPILCEAYRRLGRVAGTTLAKACQDAFKTIWLRDVQFSDARLILLIANEDLEKRLTQGEGWRVAMLRSAPVLGTSRPSGSLPLADENPRWNGWHRQRHYVLRLIAEEVLDERRQIRIR